MKISKNGHVHEGKSPAAEFILSTYNPRVALFSSPAATEIASKNNLTVAQLLAPFCTAKVDVSWHEPLNGQLIVPRGMRITVVDVATKKKIELDSQSGRKILQETVTRNIPLLETSATIVNQGNIPCKATKSVGVNYIVDEPQNSPWYNAWREQFLRLHADSHSSQYDYLNHYVACLLVMSSSDGKSLEDISEIVGNLSKLQQQHQNTWTNSWAFPSVLKYYLILHEKSQENEKADFMYQNLRTTYGGNFCFMVQLDGVARSENINGSDTLSDIWKPYVVSWPEESNESKDAQSILNSEFEEHDVVINSNVLHPLSPDCKKLGFDSHNVIPQNGKILMNHIKEIDGLFFGQHLSQADTSNIQLAVNDFVSKALLPYINRQSRLLHESIVNRRGMSKSFFSATKRLFGGSAKSPSSIVYTNESLEMMTRRLADIYFLFGHYAGSYLLYYQLKKDFLGDSAWVYYASSLEMAAVSHFMMSQVEPPLAMARAFPVHYVNDALTYYIDNCRMPSSAIKCAIICCECLKQMENFSEAASIFIKMTSEDCDLRSALMLEQASYSFLRVNFVRKYALHCVLAGYRYAKAGMRFHSLKCYLLADQIYFGRSWRFAEDHIKFTIARHQAALKLNTDCTKNLQLPTPSAQPIQQFYRDYFSNPIPKVAEKNTLVGSSKIPVFSSIKLEYSTLKMLNPTTFLGLLKAHNLTPDCSITIQNLAFSNEKLQIKEINSIPVNLFGKENSNSIILTPMESKNTVLKCTSEFIHMDQFTGPVVLQLFWEMEKTSIQTPTSTSLVPGQSLVPVEDLSHIIGLEENQFMFELSHSSEFENDFNSNPSFLCDVQLVIHSKIRGSFLINLEKASEKASPPNFGGPGVKASGDEVLLVGKTTWMLDFQPNQPQTLKYTIAVLQPGVFNIAPTISITNKNESSTHPRKYILHSPLLVAHQS